MPPSCFGQEGQALARLYQGAAFCVKQESGFASTIFRPQMGNEDLGKAVVILEIRLRNGKPISKRRLM
jgi:hypothetical protein